MTFLKKFGEVAVRCIQIALSAAPLISAAAPQAAGVVSMVASELEQLAAVIQTIEVAGQMLQVPGPQKLQMATPSIAQVILQSSLMVGKKIANPDLFRSGCQAVADGMCKILNSLHPDAVQVTDKTA